MLHLRRAVSRGPVDLSGSGLKISIGGHAPCTLVLFTVLWPTSSYLHGRRTAQTANSKTVGSTSKPSRFSTFWTLIRSTTVRSDSRRRRWKGLESTNPVGTTGADSAHAECEGVLTSTPLIHKTLTNINVRVRVLDLHGFP